MGEEMLPHFKLVVFLMVSWNYFLDENENSNEISSELTAGISWTHMSRKEEEEQSRDPETLHGGAIELLDASLAIGEIVELKLDFFSASAGLK